MNKNIIIKTALGVALIVPCAIAGKFIGAGVGAVAGGIIAFSAGDHLVDYLKAKLAKPEVAVAEQMVKRGYKRRATKVAA